MSSRGIQNERGIALPFVLAVTVLAFLLTTAALAGYSHSLQGAQMEQKRVRAQYAAESGIARMQQKVCDDPAWNQSLSTPMNGMKTETRIEGTSGGRVRIHSVAEGEGVRQTIRVEVDRKSCQVVRWEP
ncbi:hypothetical protein ACFQ5F_14030 [Kroppenstedtia eburnea]|uniref:hypothetical protein n=1 Tax=Kroppenstedtia eburnea TaxID=714067 RepID=UPI00362EC66E